MSANNTTPVTISTMSLRPKSYWIVAVSSMEQIIGAAISTLVGIILPMMQMARHSDFSPLAQGIIGATGLIGIAIGSPLIGKLSDRQGYLGWFRICPLLIMIGGILGWIGDSVWTLVPGLFLAGIGAGGGYSLDSAYIGELLPDKWRLVMVGVAKASCAIGFIGVALFCWLLLDKVPDPAIWNKLMLVLTFMGLITFLMRINWAESPKWLVSKGRIDEARRAVEKFYGKDVQIPDSVATSQQAPKADNVSWGSMFRGENLGKAILCGIPWACEGLGVYGFGVFLPVLVMALGIDHETVEGIHKVINSVEITALVNFFILPGFILGLMIMNRVSHIKMLTVGFIASAIGLVILYFGYTMHLAAWVMIAGFIVFEVALNGGPHLVTYILPSQVYPISDRGTGSGLAAMNGKVGAIVGVVLMPLLLDAGGPRLVLIVSALVMLTGALIAQIFKGSMKNGGT